jgi:outer membrane immunogenic protein
MKHVFGTFALASSVMLAVPALAADLAYKAAPSPAVVVDSWSGFYIGGNVGYSAGRERHSSSEAFILGAAAGLTSTNSGSRSLTGVIGGGQIGYNWQVGPNWVLGFETDFQGSDQKNNSSSVTNAFAANGTVQTATGSAEERLDWFGTVRARAGYVIGNSLLYGTGGFAYGKFVSNETLIRGPGAPGFTALNGAGSVSGTKTGFTVGGGIETKLGGNWTAKVEYLYMDLGTLTNAYPVFTPAGAVFSNVVSTSDLKDHIFRVGLNYKFGNAGYSGY